MSNPRRGFTLLELLVLLSIVAILAGLFLPGIGRARPPAFRAACNSNMRQIGIGLELYWRKTNRFPGEDGMRALTRVDADAVRAWIDPAERAEIVASPGTPVVGHQSGMLRAMSDLMVQSGLNDPNLYQCQALGAADFKGDRYVGEDGTAWLGLDNLNGTLSFGLHERPPPSLVVYGDRVRYGLNAWLDIGPPDATPVHVARNAKDIRQDEAAGVNHNGDGRNLLYGDGHAQWCVTDATTGYTPSGPAALTVPDAHDPADNLFLVTEKPDAGSDGTDTGLY